MPPDETPPGVATADTGPAPAPAGESALELYKLAVEMADRISARRALANTFFLTVNTGLAALLGGEQLSWYVAVAGLVFALAWSWLLQSYRKLSWAKFQVISALESRLPVRLYSTEWQHLESMKAPRRVWPPTAPAGVGEWLPRTRHRRALGAACVRRHLRRRADPPDRQLSYIDEPIALTNNRLGVRPGAARVGEGRSRSPRAMRRSAD